MSKFKYQKIQPEIMEFLNSYTDWTPFSATGGVAQVYQFTIEKIREKIPSNVNCKVENAEKG